jgi:hypothetical protein
MKITDAEKYKIIENDKSIMEMVSSTVLVNYIRRILSYTQIK